MQLLILIASRESTVLKYRILPPPPRWGLCVEGTLLSTTNFYSRTVRRRGRPLPAHEEAGRHRRGFSLIFALKPHYFEKS